MNTNKIYAEHIANEYSAKKESKVIALKKLDRKAKLPAKLNAPPKMVYRSTLKEVSK